MTITVQIRQVYGNETIYPVCNHSRMLAAIAKTKTLTGEMLQILRANGYEIKVDAPTLRFAA